MVEQLLSMHEAPGSITLKNHSLKSPPGPAKMAQQVKALATKPGNEFDPQNSHCRMREPTLKLSSFLHMPATAQYFHVHTDTCTQNK